MSNDLLKGIHIAITRPVDQARRLSEDIQQHGGKSHLFPLIAISPLKDYSEFDRSIKELDIADWAIFISTNSVNQSLPRIIKTFGTIPKNLKFAAIGPQTAKELALFGIDTVLIPQKRFDSEALLDLTEMQDVINKNIIIFRGIGGRDILADTLKSRGAKISFAECYQRINPQESSAPLAELCKNKQCDAVVVTSSEAMRYLLKLTDNGKKKWMSKLYIFVNHARIADQAHETGLKVVVAKAPGDDAMLECLTKFFSENHEKQ